jgi:hypothetical protein
VINSVNISPTSNGKENIATISIPFSTDGIRIVSAIEKDQSGNIIAQSYYPFGKGTSSLCGFPFYDLDNGQKNNAAIIFDDIGKSSHISCNALPA